ncbi:MAG: hypothetical protein HY686_09465 [Chloroflexi bacterium]|nr:hypothetical protein [Chloroflexota bacterium]
MMRGNLVKEKLQRGEPVVGAFCNIPSPAAVEILGLLGFDYAIIDGEHGIPDLETSEHMFRAAEAVGITPLVRIALNLPQNILRYLDAGAMGVQIPMVNTREDAQAVVNAVKYPPVGRRGLAAVRAAGYGIPRALGEYVQQANQETLVIVQIETRQAVANARGIASVDGVDLVFLGPTDLSSSFGYPGQATHPEVMAAIEQVGKIAREAGKAAGTIARDPAAYEHWRKAGFQYLCTGVTAFMVEGARAYLNGAREREKGLLRMRTEEAVADRIVTLALGGGIPRQFRVADIRPILTKEGVAPSHINTILANYEVNGDMVKRTGAKARFRRVQRGLYEAL